MRIHRHAYIKKDIHVKFIYGCAWFFNECAAGYVRKSLDCVRKKGKKK